MTHDALSGLRNIGPAMRADLALLGVDTLEQLAACEPDALYAALQARTGRRQDPCVWDVFAAVIHQARTGEALDWWAFTPVRKRLQAAGRFPPSAPPSAPASAPPSHHRA
ncbi:MAG: mitomycin resistance protein [Rubrivivax sp.]|nr:mitomycin resistance protein [Rubrivivax sp.]